MTLDEKRDVIILLLCASNQLNLTWADELVGHRTGEPLRIALGLRQHALRDAGYECSYVESCVEAAYRLIESHPALRCEWFT